MSDGLRDEHYRAHVMSKGLNGSWRSAPSTLTELQRTYHVAVVLVHHARKGGAKMRAGQALRGSSEFHAWGDSNLYLRRLVDHQLTLSVEHRAAASISTVSLHLDTADEAVALTAIDPAPAALATAVPAEVPIDQRILAELAIADAPLSATALRKRCRIRNATLQAALAALVADGRIRRDRAGYAVAR